MRQFIRCRAVAHGLDGAEAFQAQLVATEAVTNAIRYGRGEQDPNEPITVSCVWREDGLTIEVGDHGRFRHRPPASPEDPGGRGLKLIGRFTRRFDLETSDSGTRLSMLVGGAC